MVERRWETRRLNARIVFDSLPMSFLWGGQLHPDLGSGIVLVPFRAQSPTDDALASVHRVLNRYRIADLYAFVRIPVDDPIPQAFRHLFYLSLLLADALFLSFTSVRTFPLGALS